jgi:6,7-dimethyl-8-ribityllumazine synthase
MSKIYEGHYEGKGLKIGIVCSRFNEMFVSKLLGGAKDSLLRHGVADADIEVAWVPGAFEIPLMAQKMANSKKYDAVITLGVVIRGSTPHFDYVCAEVSKGVASVGMQSNLPVIFGVLTVNNLEEAIERSGSKMGNKGTDAAMAALEMVNVLKQFG